MCNMKELASNSLLIIIVSSSVLLNGINGINHESALTSKSILDEPSCAELKRFCNNFSENKDLLILECLQSVSPNVLSQLKTECQNVIWSHIGFLISNDNVNRTLFPICNLKDLQCPGGSNDLLKCIVNNKDKVTSTECRDYILRLEYVAFQDYRWIGSFLKECQGAVEELKCGRIDSAGFSQLQTVMCLQNHIDSVNEGCKNEVFRLSALQSDSIKLDQQLFLDCIQDHSKFCQLSRPGTGSAFNCLIDHQDQLSVQCRKNIFRRQKLIAQDFRVSKGLMRACREDIKKVQCRKHTSGDKNTRLAQILLCLENIAKNNTKLDPECEVEMVKHRRLLMEDYRLSPEIVDSCKTEIKWCSEAGIETGGKTIHCLMDHIRIKNINKPLGRDCKIALQDLMKQTDAGEDWTVDPVLHQSCYPVVQSVCRDIKGGDARIMSCLMDNIGTDHMVDECEDALIQIQYFVARDFKLDPQLYRACKESAQKLCQVDPSWETFSSSVLPCLYRNAFDNDKEEMKPTASCVQQIRRVMHQRAISVDLHPEIEEACMFELSDMCVDKTKKGEEIKCLQNNFGELQDECKKAVEVFTEAEGQHADLNPYIVTHCRKEMESLCAAELKNDQGDVMECLVAHKNHPSLKTNLACRASVEHFQIISLKDYKFTYKFKTACKNHAMRFCALARTKYEVISCLSEKVTNDTIQGRKSDISKDCRQQMKAQIFQQRENIDLNPLVKQACSADIKQHCAGIPHGNSQVLECLQMVNGKLTSECEKEVFKLKKQEMTDNSVDYALMTMCADAIDLFCPNHDKSTILDCLKVNKDQKGFNKKCRMIVLHRLIEQNSNYQLNPSLQENCKPDIKKYCFNNLQTFDGKDINDRVIKCLKFNFKHAKLSNKCQREMESILRDQALNVNLNPLLRAVCKNELETICKLHDEDMGHVEECLKNALLNKQIATRGCQVEVANMITESEADIQVDPLLQTTCSLDLLNNCRDVPQGNGRHIKCLKMTMENNPKGMSHECKEMLKKRLDMYRNAEQLQYSPQNIQELYVQVAASPARHYFFFLVFSVVGAVFVIGMFCGRTSRRHVLIKNK